ncbi:MAG TPA: glycoside hydrolase family 3 N-terminal domain-containing protein [Thermoanaerobaculia bacterium]|nr:glycoside hydrolase family 3 N-terminal domain-containing protein [Thermoanaerobaculia bacterium]
MKRTASILFCLLALSCASGRPARDVRVEALTLDEKIGQLFVYAANGDFMNAASPQWLKLVRLVEQEHVGGIHWYAADVLETAWMNAELQQRARVPLLVSADLESGVGMRFADGTSWPWAMAMAAVGDEMLVERAGAVVAREALSVGINQIYAPVADVNNDPDNPVINVRSFGEDPDEVARFVSAFVRGVEREGVLATVKHFPGHGDTQTDSHRSLPILEVTRQRLDRIELVPFRAAIDAGVGSVMIAHLALPEIDPAPVPVREDRSEASNPYGAAPEEVARDASVPASLSSEIVDGILRRDLGFDGLVVTDAIDMGGIVHHFDAGEAAVRAIEAGVDQVVKPDDVDAAIAGVRRAVAEGRLSEERIDLSVRRVLEAKRGVARPGFDPRRVTEVFDAPAHRELAAEIAQRAVTLLREAPGALPVDRSARVVELVVSDVPEAAAPVPHFAAELARRLDRPPSRFLIDRRSSRDEIPAIIEAAREADLVVVSLMVRTRSGAGRAAVPSAARAAVEWILSAPRPPKLVAVAFGNPYVVREIPTLPTVLATYGPQPLMQIAAARALFGEAAIGGRLPVTIPGMFERGSGIDRAIAD